MAGQAEAAQQRPQVRQAEPAPADGGVRSRGDRVERVMQRRGGRAGKRGVGAAGHARLDHREAAHLLGAEPQAAQSAAHGRRRHAQVRADPREPAPPSAAQAGADHLDRVGAPGRSPGRQHDVRAAAGPAAGPVRPQPRGRAARQPDDPFPACPHLASRPVPQDGQASSPPARSAAASAHSSTAGLPDHDGHDARGRAPRPGGARVAACPARRRPATQTAPDVSKRHSEHRRESRHRLSQHELPDARGVVAHENGHRPPDPDRHAHAGRRQTSSTCSGRTARNTRSRC